SCCMPIFLAHHSILISLYSVIVANSGIPVIFCFSFENLDGVFHCQHAALLKLKHFDRQ
ncbi:hypothetical protein GUJ93_ZPchr0226g7151, partial [Zizania palustris]